MPLTDSVLQPLVKIVDGTGRHFSNGELARVFVQLFLQLRLGTHGLVHLTVQLQKLLLLKRNAGVDSSKKCVFRNVRKARDLVVGTGEAGTNSWRE